MQESAILVCSIAGLLSLFSLIAHSFWSLKNRLQLSDIPTIGPSGVLSSYIGAYRFFFNAKDMIHEGYTKYYGSAFKVPMVSRWMVVVSGPGMIDDIRKATDDQLSFSLAVSETFQTEYTLGAELRLHPYHVSTVRTPLTRNLAVRFGDVQDEIIAAFTDTIPPSEKEWLRVPAFKTIMQIVCRTSNRLFVGLPLCRNAEYRTLNEQFTVDVAMAANILNVFPAILRPLVNRTLTNIPAGKQRALKHLRPVIQERLDKEAQYGPDWPGKPNDLITWLLENAPEDHKSVEDLSKRVLTVNFAAIHTTSMAFTHALYNLGSFPEYVQPMREEVEAVISEDGWSKVSMTKLRKLDSFLKESARTGGTGALLMSRKVLQDFTFSNGTTLPAGHFVSVAAGPMHLDEGNYANADKFDGFRFSRIREEEGESLKHQLVSLSLDFVGFGNGRHACPGRFFAVNELKAMLAHVLLTYDVKLVDDVRPANRWYGPVCVPNPNAEVMFRKRSV